MKEFYDRVALQHGLVRAEHTSAATAPDLLFEDELANYTTAVGQRGDCAAAGTGGVVEAIVT